MLEPYLPLPGLRRYGRGMIDDGRGSRRVDSRKASESAGEDREAQRTAALDMLCLDQAKKGGGVGWELPLDVDDRGGRTWLRRVFWLCPIVHIPGG